MELYELTLVVTCVQEKAIRDVFAQNDWKFIIAGVKKHEQECVDSSPTNFGRKEEPSNIKVPDHEDSETSLQQLPFMGQSKLLLSEQVKKSSRQEETINGQEETTVEQGEVVDEGGEMSSEHEASGGPEEPMEEEGEATSEQGGETDDGEDQVEEVSTDQTQKDPECKWIYCLICGEVFKEICALEIHMKKHESPSRKRSKFLSLVKSRTSPRNSCKQEEPTAEVSPIQNHSKPSMSVRGRPQKSTDIPTLKHEEFKCATCLESFQDIDDLSLHLKSHVDQMPFVCTECGEMFKARDDFEDHLINHSQKTKSVAVAPSPRNPKRLCKTCERSFPNQAALIVHERVHSGERPYLCTDCGKAFKQVSAFQSHTRTHTGETPYKCKLCDEAFRQLGELQRHVRKHTGEKPHLCTVCGNRFAELSYLKSHMRLHTGEKPYQCIYCGKSFSQRTSLKVHIKCHHKTTKTAAVDRANLDATRESATDCQSDPEFSRTFPVDMSLHIPLDSYNMSYLASGLSQTDRDRNPMPMSFDIPHTLFSSQ